MHDRETVELALYAVERRPTLGRGLQGFAVLLHDGELHGDGLVGRVGADIRALDGDGERLA